MKLKEFLEKKQWKKWDKSQWTILILTGILLMIVAMPTGEKKEGEAQENTEEKMTESAADSEGYGDKLERRLGETLSKIAGAGRVEVMITFEDTGESIVEKDQSKETQNTTETDSGGGSRTVKSENSGESTVYTENGDTREPFVENEKMPKIAGILVVAQGGDQTAVKQNISDAVMALFQIDVNRIKVVKMNIQEEEY